MNTAYYDIIKIAVSFLLGALLGSERQYRNKPAGFRTLILISVGATLFTILSNHISANPDRIAANIVTGIGFIGAGVIFKEEGLKVSGMTTAATIWIAAAIGMAVGYGEFYLAVVVTLLMIFTLVLLENLEVFLQRFHQVRFYRIVFMIDEYSVAQLEEKLVQLNINYIKDREIKNKEEFIVFYRLVARQQEFDVLNRFLMETKPIASFEV